MRGSDVRASFLVFASLTEVLLFYLAVQWRNDPRNPYAAELAKEALH